jgi:hypothetical protein
MKTIKEKLDDLIDYREVQEHRIFKRTIYSLKTKCNIR